MDVTSLLNTGAAAAEQLRRMESTRTPTRSRTPWDAGGYSLPINTLSMAPQTTPLQQVQQMNHNESQPLESHTPTSPNHKFSDSRSSLSSFTSSLQSTTHSRYSSMSTVNSAHPLNTVSLDSLSPKPRNGPQSLELASIDSSNDTRYTTSLSPTGSLEALALVAEHHPFSKKPSQNFEERLIQGVIKTDLAHSLAANTTQPRPSSPSDAILIKRSAIPTLRVNTGDADLNRSYHQQQNFDYLSASFENHQQTPPQGASHKRSVSAPDFPVIPGHKMSRSKDSKDIRPRAQPTPPSSHPDHASPVSDDDKPAGPTPDTPLSTTADKDAGIYCMYITDCDTGSAMRKAVSHIFGRNKMCTRMIPPRIWVYYCRKHYQRSRYRNPKEYCKVQCDLVQEQIHRITDWSDANRKIGAPGVVMNWSLVIRKREQKRLEELESSSRKRGAAMFDRETGNEDETAAEFNQGKPPPSWAVPKWLQNMIGTGYTTEQILEIFKRLHTEILEDRIPSFPDIEILPNIKTEEEPKDLKGYTKRAPPTISHKRSQSLGASIHQSLSRRSSHSSHSSLGSFEDFTFVSPQKRRRPNPFESVSQERMQIPARMGVRQMDPARLTSVFQDIDEHQGEDDFHPSRSYGSNLYTPPPSQQQPLPAPIAQRSNGHSVATRLETNSHFGQNSARPGHNRSRSDFAGFGHTQLGFSSYDISMNINGPVAPFQHEAPSNARYEQPGHQNSRSEMSLASTPSNHQRHLSTPNAVQSYTSPTAPYGRYFQPHHQARPARTHPRNTTSPTGRVSETDKTREMYSERR